MPGQFVEMTRLRIEGLLGAFTKLVDSGKDHTFVRALAGMGPRPISVETERATELRTNPVARSVRYVYQPMEALNLVVITNKASNILEERSSAAAQQNGSVARFESKLMRLAVASQTSDVLEDLETLRLLAKVVQDCCEIQVSEENVEPLGRAEWMSTVWSPLLLRVLKHAFDIVFAFDEVTLSQIKTYTEMDSHEERPTCQGVDWQDAKQTELDGQRNGQEEADGACKILSADGCCCEKAKQRALQPKDAAGPGFGSRRLGCDYHCDSLPGIGPSSMGHWSAASILTLDDSATSVIAARPEVGGGSFQDTMPSMGGGASFGNDSTAPWTSSMVEALGKKKNADVLGSMGIPEPTPSPEERRGPWAASELWELETVQMDPVRVDIEASWEGDVCTNAPQLQEKITADLQVEGGLEGEAVCTGQFQAVTVTVLDASKADLAAFRLAPQNQEFRSHANNVLEVREASRAYRANAPVPLVKSEAVEWKCRLTTPEADQLLAIHYSSASLGDTALVWSRTKDGTQIVVELELTDASVTLEESSADSWAHAPEMLPARFVMPCCCMLLVAAVLALADAFVVPSSPHASSAPSRINKIDRAEPMISSDAGAVFMSVLAGLIVGVAVPASSFAAESAAPAGTEKAASTPQSRKEATYAEMKKVSERLQAAPSKADRLKASQQQLTEYAKKADYDSTGV
ncbi:ARCN1 [Symbiodinium microadriaticum]|nr:ARCN1 [Symbiodinium microadriaticum]